LTNNILTLDQSEIESLIHERLDTVLFSEAPDA
jgi:hypothetical protein